MRLHVLHETTYRYDPPVATAQHLAHLSPGEHPGQRLLSHSLAIAPEPSHQSSQIDAFGNPSLHFMLSFPHESLRVCAASSVLTEPPAPCPDGQPWEHIAAALRYRAGAPFDPASEYLFPSPYVPRDPTLADFARDLFPPGRPVLQAAHALMQRIHADMRYASGSTTVHTPVLQALAQRQGVCQDFAHLMIGCLRSLGLPARYVSGYLLTQPPPGQPRLIGADASHAWVQVYAPPIGWVDFDPTNNLCGWGRPSEGHITLAIGRDFGDVSPLRGLIQGGGNPQLSVAVTVAPSDELPALLASARQTPDPAPPSHS